VSKTDAIRVRVKSEGYREDIVDLDSLEVRPSEDNKAISFIRGTCARFKQLGYKTGGLVAYTTSQVLKASGLSSSAAFEVAIGTILNNEFNEGKVEAIEIAQIAQYAENVYFGKLSGLMDQMASSVGSFVSIDFADNSKPVIDKVNFDFVSSGYSICIVDSGSGHADVTDEYSLVTKEMKAVARFFDRDVLREVDESEFYANIPEIRKKTGDRAVLRAIHFFDDNRRAWEEAEALRKGDFPAFLKLIELSGTSSFMHLQNVAVGSVPEKQPIPLALALSQKILAGEGASRVHGGGFGGTIQAFVPNWLLEKYRTEINKALGENSCHVIFVRPYGGICISDMI
jgi:galactokinase